MFRRSVAALLLSIAATAVSAQNLIVNGEFDQDDLGWTASDSLARNFTTLDWDNAANSGSVRISNNLTWSTLGILWQCVAVQAPLSVDFSASSYHDWQNGTFDNRPILEAFDSADCSGTDLGSLGQTVVSQPNTWFQATLTRAPLPANTQSVLVVIPMNWNGASFIDHVVLAPAADDVLFSDGFDAN